MGVVRVGERVGLGGRWGKIPSPDKQYHLMQQRTAAREGANVLHAACECCLKM